MRGDKGTWQGSFRAAIAFALVYLMVWGGVPAPALAQMAGEAMGEEAATPANPPTSEGATGGRTSAPSASELSEEPAPTTSEPAPAVTESAPATEDVAAGMGEELVTQESKAEESSTQEQPSGYAALGERDGTALAPQSVNVSNPRIGSDDNMESGQVVTWDCVWLGSYPQTEAAETDALRDADWVDSDAVVGGVRYRRISRNDATSDYCWPDEAGAYRYFRYEPIKWRILKVDGNTALAVADNAIDCRQYNVFELPLTWETSDIRSWLNGMGSAPYFTRGSQSGYTAQGFSTVAFTTEQLGAVRQSSVTNADNTEYGTPGGNNTTDRIFLLSEAEVYGVAAAAHGFASSYNTPDEARRCKASNFAIAMGARTYLGAPTGNCAWRLRSPGDHERHAADVDSGGRLDRSGSSVGIEYAVRPALNLNLLSNHLTFAGTVSSDGTMDETGAPGESGSGDEPSGNTNIKTTTMALGADASGSVQNADALKFFPGNFSAKLTLVPVQYSEDVGDDGSITYKLAIGTGRKDILDNKTTWNQFKANVSAAKSGLMSYDALAAFAAGKTCSAFTSDGFKAVPKLGVTAYGEFKYKDGVLVSNASCVVAKADWKAKADWQFWTPIGPVYIELAGGVAAKLDGKADFDQASSKTTLSGTLSLVPSISLEGGYGIASVATLGVRGSAEVPIQVAPPTKGEFEAKASLHGYIVFVVDWTYDLAQFKVTLWDTVTSGGLGTQSVDVSGEGTFSEVDRSYAERTSAWSGGGGLSVQDVGDAASFSVLQESVMPNTIPLVAEAGGNRVMVFQRNDPARGTLDSSELAYSVLEDGAWSEPRAVWDTGTLDAYADLKAVGDDLYVVWQKERGQITGDVAADAQGVLGQIAAGSEVCIARFDPATGTFTDAQYVTDNSQLDMMPTLSEDAGEPQVAFVRNTANALDQVEGSTQVVLATRDGSGWGESVVAEAQDYVREVAASSAGGQAQVAYATVGDGDVGAGEGSVWLAGAGASLTQESEQPTGLQWEGGRLWWTTDGLVRSYDPASGEVATVNEGAVPADNESPAKGAVVGDGMRVLADAGKTAVVWTETDAEAPSATVHSAVLGADGRLSDAVGLCSLERGIAASDVLVESDGSYSMVVNTFDGEGTHDLEWAGIGTVGTLETMGSSAYVSDDGKVALTYGFQNNGEAAMDGYELVIYDGAEVVERRVVEGAVAAGGQGTGEASFVLPEGSDGSGLRVEVAPLDAGDPRQPAGSDVDVATDATLAEAFEDVGTEQPEPVQITSVTLEKDTYVYDGTEKRPGVTVMAGDDVVPADGYEVSYDNNVEVGTATVTVTGKGDYAGSKSVTFEIEAPSQPAPSPASTVRDGVDWSPVYDPAYYAAQNPDVETWATRADGTVDGDKLLQHFVNNGAREGRKSKDGFELASYYNANVDLRRAFGTSDWSKYYRHYATNGARENRACSGVGELRGALASRDGVDWSPVYDGVYYAAQNGDVARWASRACGADTVLDDAALLSHFVGNGAREGRASRATFGLAAYYSANADLRRAFGTSDWSKYYRHYATSGAREGRVCSGVRELRGALASRDGVDWSPVYDANFYADRNADVAGWASRACGAVTVLDDFALLQHFVVNGAKEGRRSKAGFELASYYNANADLRRAFGTDWARYYRHYATNGAHERRTCSGVGQLRGFATSSGGVDWAPVYDANEYASRNADLASWARRSFNSGSVLDDAALLQHFVNNGQRERRQAKPTFNVTNYRNRYADLRSAFGDDWPCYYRHFATNGYRENRNGT